MSDRPDNERSVRHAAGVLVCPSCGIPLRGSDHAQGIAWRCRACGGQSLNFSQFRRMVPEHGANDIWNEAAARPRPARLRTKCPECLAGMDAVFIPFRGHWVELDICRPCQRLWLDRDEGRDGSALSLAPLAPALPTPQQQREQLFALLQFRADVEEERKEGRMHLTALKIALIAAGVVMLLTWSWRFGIQLRLAAAAGVVCYAVRMLWRRQL